MVLASDVERRSLLAEADHMTRMGWPRVARAGLDAPPYHPGRRANRARTSEVRTQPYPAC